MIERYRRGDVEVFELAHGKVSALDLEFSNALADELETVAKHGSPLVITGRGSVFSAGVDLFRIVDSGPDYVDSFLQALDRVLETLFFHPAPVVAAINGHAIAGGCIIAQACDYRVMGATAGTIGVPELRVGVPFPPLALEILRFAARPDSLQKTVYLGETMTPDDALRSGLLDEVVPADEVLDRAATVAGSMGKIPRATFQATKSGIRAIVRERVASCQTGRDEEIRQVWSSPEIHEIIRSYLGKTIGRQR